MGNRNAVVDPLIENNIVVYRLLFALRIMQFEPRFGRVNVTLKQFWSEVLIGFISQVQVK